MSPQTIKQLSLLFRCEAIDAIPDEDHPSINRCHLAFPKNTSTTSLYTPRKINMEPENTPLEKEHHLNQTIIFRFYVNLLRWILPETNMAPENRPV